MTKSHSFYKGGFSFKFAIYFNPKFINKFYNNTTLHSTLLQ